MVEPKTIREVAIDLAAFKREVDPQFRFLSQMLMWIGAVVVGIAGGGVAIWVQIGDLKATAAATARDVAALSERMGRIEKDVSDIGASQTRIGSVLSRIDARLAAAPSDQGPFAPLAFSADEERFIREYLKLPMASAGPPKFSLGDPLPGASPVPDELAAKVPKLKGAKFLYDPNGYAIFVGAGDRVVAIIGPG